MRPGAALLWIGLSGGVVLGTWEALVFRQEQEALFLKTRRTHDSLLKNLQILEEDRTFQQTHGPEITTLLAKGWVEQTPRLMAADWLETLRPFLRASRLPLSRKC